MAIKKRKEMGEGGNGGVINWLLCHLGGLISRISVHAMIPT